MATPQQARIPNEFEALSDLYLSLCTQIDLLIGENKWLEIRPLELSEVREQARGEMEQLQRRFPDSGILEKASRDYRRTQELVDRNGGRALSEAEKKELGAFKDYLQDEGFGYGEKADEA